MRSFLCVLACVWCLSSFAWPAECLAQCPGGVCPSPSSYQGQYLPFPGMVQAPFNVSDRPCFCIEYEVESRSFQYQPFQVLNQPAYGFPQVQAGVRLYRQPALEQPHRFRQVYRQSWR